MLLERLLHLRSGDFRRGLPLFSYYFLIIASSQIGQIARDALFLDRFEAIQLPYADVTVCLLTAVIVALYIRLGRRGNLRDLLIGSLCFYIVNLVVLWGAIHFYQWPSLYLILYVWVGVFGVLAPAQVWTLASFVWTTREAKRLFGMLGSGGIAGGIFAGLFSWRMAGTFGTESLLPMMAFLLAVAVGVVAVVWRSRPVEQPAIAAVTAEGPRNLLESCRLISQSPHLKTIVALVFLSSCVAGIAAWQIKAVAAEAFVSKNELAVFFSQFDFWACLVALAAQLFLTGKILHRFGIGVALAALPASLLLGSMSIVMWGTLWAVCLLKGSERVFRYSIDTSAQQLLYLPVSPRVKLQVKAFIDTVIWRAGGGFAALLLLIFATGFGFTASQIGWVCLAFVLLWLATASFARRQYVATLGESIRQLEMDADAGPVPVLDNAASNVIMDKLRSTDPGEILQALGLFEMGQQLQVLAAVRGLLDHPSAGIRAKAVSILSEAGDTSVHEAVHALLHDADLQVRTEALSYISRHDHIDPIANLEELGKFSDFSICSATIAFLSRPGETQNIDAARFMMDAMVGDNGENGVQTRRAAAQLIGALPDYFEVQLAMLLQDSDAEVVRCALRAMSALRKQSLIPVAVERLADPVHYADAMDALSALATFENSSLDALAGYLNDATLQIEVRRHIPFVLLRVGTAPAAKSLADNVLQADSVLRYRIISSLNKLQELRVTPFDRAAIESVLVAEIMGHYRSYQILGTLKSETDLLREPMERELERIFRLMKLLFPSIDLENAYRGIQSRDHATHANALEFLENTLSAALRTLLLPLIDSEVGIAERIRLADRFLNTRLTSREEAVAALVHSEDPWLKSAALRLIGKFGMQRFSSDVERLKRDPDPLLRRIAEAGSML